MSRQGRSDPVAKAAGAPPAEAERLLRKHLKKRPKDARVLRALAEILAPQGRLEDIASPLVAVASRPDADPQIIEHAWQAATSQSGFEVARRLAVHGTTLHPEDATMWFLRGRAEMAAADAPSAVGSLERAFELSPEDTSILAALADADISKGAFPIPDKYARQLLDLEPDVAAHHVRLGTAQRFNDALDDAEASFRHALQLDPEFLPATAGLAETLESAGRSEEAAAVLTPVMNQSSPSFATVSAWARVQQRLGRSAESISAMERYLASNRGNMTHRANMLMRLGRAYEHSGRYGDAFRCWMQGNAAHRGRWNPDARQGIVEAMMATFDQDSIASLPKAEPAPFTPILVVGMYRSGTTLTEQILSAHPDIVPAGESPAMPNAVRTLAEDCGALEDFPGSIRNATVDIVRKAACVYTNQVLKFAQGAFIVDKLPMNYLNLGIASLLLPNAKVLYLMRDPMDTAISCFSQSFASRMAFTADLEHLGQTIAQERRIMAHWRRVIPLPLHVVTYETLAREPEQTIRGVLDFLGLPWDSDVLEFHTSNRVAATPSMDQVRRPINTSAVGRAAHFKDFLEPLREAMGSLNSNQP